MATRLRAAVGAALSPLVHRYATIVEYAGVAAIAYGVFQVSHAAGWITAGTLAVAEAALTAVR